MTRSDSGAIRILGHLAESDPNDRAHNFAVDRTAGSHSLAAAGHRERCADRGGTMPTMTIIGGGQP